MEFKNVLALLITIALLLLLGFIIIFPFYAELHDVQGNGEIMNKYIDKVSALISGILGTILGYYFGKQNKADTK